MKKNIFKKMVLWGLVIIGIGLIFSSCISFAQVESPLYIESTESHPIDPDSLQGKIISAVEKVSPAVVSISTEKTVSTAMGFESPQEGGSSPFDDFFKRFFEDFPQRSYKTKGLGSGMIIDKDGYILTDEHVIHGVDKDKIKVSLLDGRTLKANVIVADEEMDIAILKIEGDNFPTVIMGDSDNLKIGEFVIAIGNPYGYALSELKKKYEPTATLGIVSAKERAMQASTGREVKTYTDLIQTDASINPGNSGGPLINIYGEVIGINTAIYTPTGSSIGIGFAIPINKAKRILDSFTKYGKVKWSWIGIYMQPELTEELAKKFGVKKGILVADVVKDSPADKAEIKAGDVIQKINGKEVTSPVELAEEVRKVEIGKEISLTLIRKGKEITLTLTTTERPEEIAKKETEQEIEQGKEGELLGMKVESLTPEIRKKYNIKESEKGVVVNEVESGGPADKIGITPGAVIMEVNHKTIENMDDFEKAMEGIKPGDTVLLRIRQGWWTIYTTLQTRKINE